MGLSDMNYFLMLPMPPERENACMTGNAEKRIMKVGETNMLIFFQLTSYSTSQLDISGIVFLSCFTVWYLTLIV